MVDVAVKTHEPHSENVDQTPHALPSRPAASGSGSPAGTLALGNFPGIPGLIFCLRKLISYPPHPLLLSQGFVPGTVARDALDLP